VPRVRLGLSEPLTRIRQRTPTWQRRNTAKTLSMAKVRRHASGPVT
jgi:hypothetical protein